MPMPDGMIAELSKTHDYSVLADDDWIPGVDPDNSWFRLLYFSAETGVWAVIFRWKQGFIAPSHTHLGASHSYILKGELAVRDNRYPAGAYLFEANGSHHGATEAIVDTEYLFIGNGPLAFNNEHGELTGLFGWKEALAYKQRHESPESTSEGKK
ncbi:MAG: cupin domain-containing protein [Pseudomonadota bacterium]